MIRVNCVQTAKCNCLPWQYKVYFCLRDIQERTLYMYNVFYCCFLMSFRYYDTLKFPWTYKKKSVNFLLLLIFFFLLIYLFYFLSPDRKVRGI